MAFKKVKYVNINQLLQKDNGNKVILTIYAKVELDRVRNANIFSLLVMNMLQYFSC